MTEKDKKFIETWKIARNLGRLKYALTYGAFFGIFTYVFSSIILYYVFSERDFFHLPNIVIQLLGFLLVGFLLAYYSTWDRNNKKYNELTKK